jgi:homoserine kinase type II
MAILTSLELDAAARLGALYGLEVRGVRGLLAGSVNSNYALELASTPGRVFLRIYEEQGAAAARREAVLLDGLARAGVPTPKPLARKDGGFVAEHSGKPVALFPWIAGEALCQARVTPEAARAVGAALARVHLASPGLEASPSRFDAAHLRHRLEGLRDRELPRALREVVTRLERGIDELDGAPTPPGASGVVHGDLFRDNVLFDDGRLVALLDFESASHGRFAFDLAVTLLAWCYGDALEPRLARAMTEGYTSVRALDDADRASLYPDARFAAHRFALTRITDFELRPPGQSVHKDYRRFVARLDALEAMGERGVLRLLGL